MSPAAGSPTRSTACEWSAGRPKQNADRSSVTYQGSHPADVSAARANPVSITSSGIETASASHQPRRGLRRAAGGVTGTASTSTVMLSCPPRSAGKVDQRLNRLFRGFGSQRVFDLRANQVRQPVRAEQELRSRPEPEPLAGQRLFVRSLRREAQAQIGLDFEQAADVAAQHVGMRMVVGFFGRDHGMVEGFLHPGVVGGQLVQAAIVEQIHPRLSRPRRRTSDPRAPRPR